MPFYPGPGLGGHCIPIDPFYLTWKAREFDCATRFIELAGEINMGMPYYVVQRTVDALNERGKSIKGAKILIVGLAYKKNVDDIRESPSFKLWSLFEGKGAKVSYSDPYRAAVPKTREYPEFAGRKSVPLSKAASYDAVVVSTAHDCVDHEALAKKAKLLVDCRNAVKAAKNVVRA